MVYGTVVCGGCFSEFDGTPDRHDCTTVRAVNGYIERASRVADEVYNLTGLRKTSDSPDHQSELDARWTRVFHAEMDRLTSDAGLRRLVTGR